MNNYIINPYTLCHNLTHVSHTSTSTPKITKMIESQSILPELLSIEYVMHYTKAYSEIR